MRTNGEDKRGRGGVVKSISGTYEEDGYHFLWLRRELVGRSIGLFGWRTGSVLLVSWWALWLFVRLLFGLVWLAGRLGLAGSGWLMAYNKIPHTRGKKGKT